METYLKKVRHILPAYLLTLVGSVVGLALFRWIFSIRSSIIDIDIDLWEAYIPLFVFIIPGLIWLRKRLRILKISLIGSLFFAWLTSVVPLVMSETYLTRLTGTMGYVNEVSQLDSIPRATHYTIKHFEVVPSYQGFYMAMRKTGKSGSTINLTAYFVFPMSKDTSSFFVYLPKYWYGVRFQKQLKNGVFNRLSQRDLETELTKFRDESMAKIAVFPFHNVIYFDRLPTSYDMTGFQRAVQSRTRLPAQNITILRPRREPYELNHVEAIRNIFLAIVIGAAVFLFVLIWPALDQQEYDQQRLS